jgi:hypothetical protein
MIASGFVYLWWLLIRRWPAAAMPLRTAVPFTLFKLQTEATLLTEPHLLAVPAGDQTSFREKSHLLKPSSLKP